MALMPDEIGIRMLIEISALELSRFNIRKVSAKIAKRQSPQAEVAQMVRAHDS